MRKRICKRKSASLGLVVAIVSVGFLLGFGAFVQAAGAGGEEGEAPLQFADPALERAVRGQLVGLEGPIYPADVQLIDNLYVTWPEPGEEIHSLEGIEALTGLTRLTLAGHPLEDVGPLAHLPNLNNVSLPYNRIVDISPLAALNELERLDVSDNRISDISALADLVHLGYVNLGNNRITDLSPLRGLENLEYVLLHRNAFADVSPLLDLPALREAMLQANPGVDFCPGSPGRGVIDDIGARGADVVFLERAAGNSPCPHITDVPPVQISKMAGDVEERVIVQGGEVARLNPDGSRVVITCAGTMPYARFVNEEKGAYWEGLITEFLHDLNTFIVLHMLPDDPVARFAVQTRVVEVGAEEVAGFDARRYRVEWRPSAEEGGDDVPWQLMQEVWMAEEMMTLLAPSGCGQVVAVLEMLQLQEGAFSSQRFYGLGNSMEYAELFFAGFPVRAKLYGLDGEEAAVFEVVSVANDAASSDLFAVPRGLEEDIVLTNVLQ